MYETLAGFAQTWGLLIFIAAFVLVLIYALAPGRAKEFRHAARIPMEDEDLGEDAESNDQGQGR